MSNDGLNIDGLDEFIDMLEKSDDKCKELATKAMKNISQVALKTVKLKTPVRKKAKGIGGTLRRSWQVKKVSEYEYVLYNNTDYAVHVEFGHRTRLGKGGQSSNPNYKYKPKANGIAHVPPVYMLTNTMKEINEKFENEVEAVVEKMWED